MWPQTFCIYDQSQLIVIIKKQDYKTRKNQLTKLGNFKIITLKCMLSVIRSSTNTLHITIRITNEYSIKLSHLS